jgi:hypothetical protein
MMTDLREMTPEELRHEIVAAEHASFVILECGKWPDGWSQERYDNAWEEDIRRLKLAWEIEHPVVDRHRVRGCTCGETPCTCPF